mmetsp:Transcript_39803/g.119697  ORF Transcript_39803/g.119697 Transcript_39803/m.119697 type:complete len:213 (+) Transcript_39803:543-1181(+)
MPGTDQVGRDALGIRQHFHGDGPIRGRYARRDAVLLARVDRHGESGPLGVLVRLHHRRQFQFVHTIPLHTHANHTRRVTYNLCHRLRRAHVSCHDEIALVLTIHVVHHHDHLPPSDGRDRVLDRLTPEAVPVLPGAHALQDETTLPILAVAVLQQGRRDGGRCHLLPVVDKTFGHGVVLLPGRRTAARHHAVHVRLGRRHRPQFPAEHVAEI